MSSACPDLFLVRFTETTYRVSEGEEAVQVCVVVSPGLPEPVQLNISFFQMEGNGEGRAIGKSLFFGTWLI